MFLYEFTIQFTKSIIILNIENCQNKTPCDILFYPPIQKYLVLSDKSCAARYLC